MQTISDECKIIEGRGIIGYKCYMCGTITMTKEPGALNGWKIFSDGMLACPRCSSK